MKPNQTAIIFIEFQNDFASEGGKLFAAVQPELERNQTIPNAQRLLAGARAKGCLVIHCPFVLDAGWVADCGCTGLLSGISGGEIFAPGSWGQAIIPAMQPAEGEILLAKKRALSAFSHTDLAAILAERGIKNFIICGFLTNICVQATAFSAYDAGLTTRIALDACCATSEPIQRYVEENLPALLGGESCVDKLLEGLADA